jgi:uncharacterized protein (TIGR02246 family)
MPSFESADHAEIRALLSRYFAAINDKRLDARVVAATFASDGRILRPNGTALVGREAILEGQSASFARFRATHHVTSDHLVDIDGVRASLRAHVTAMHLWAAEESDPPRSSRTSSRGACCARWQSARRTGGASPSSRTT